MFLLSLQEYAISLIKEGAIIKDVYNQLVEKIRSEKPELEKYFVKTAGFTVGYQQLHATVPMCKILTRIPHTADWYRVQRVFLRYWTQM